MSTAGGGEDERDGAELDDAEVDARFAAIAAGLGMPESRVEVGPGGPTAGGPRDHSPEDRSADPAWGIDGFTAPDPGFEPVADPLVWVGILAVALPILAAVVAAVASRPIGQGELAAGIACIVGGVALLVWRMPTHRDQGGDGAVV